MKVIAAMLSAVVITAATMIGVATASLPLVKAQALDKPIGVATRPVLRQRHSSSSSERNLQANLRRLTGLDLINANTGKPITTLSNNSVIAVNSIPGMTTPAFNINATFVGSGIGSVVFGYNDTSNVWTENGAPWAFCGNSGPQFSACAQLGTVSRTHVVTATPFAGTSGTGAAGTPIAVIFTIVASLPTVAPIAAPVVRPPTKAPTAATVPAPTKAPSKSPVVAPLNVPVKAATKAPTKTPTKTPTKSPVVAPAKTPTRSPIVAAAPSSPIAVVTPVLIDCGSSSTFTDSQNRLWLADQYFDTQSGVFNTASPIGNTVEDKLYQTERTGVTVAYNIPRPPGTYAVTLHFAEI
jgi:Malectin domain